VRYSKNKQAVQLNAGEIARPFGDHGETTGIVNLMQRWVYFLWKVGKKERFWSLFSRRSIRKPLKNLLSGESSSKENFKLTIPSVWALLQKISEEHERYEDSWLLA
jgi:hypothetical protein